MVDHTRRVLALKLINFRGRWGRASQVDAPAEDMFLAALSEMANAIDPRHYPPLDSKIEAGEHCLFVNGDSWRLRKSGALILELGYYTKGKQYSKGQIARGARKIVLSSAAGALGSDEFIDTFRVLIKGRALIVESVRGSGGLDCIGKLLNQILRRHNQAAPAVHLKNVSNAQLEELITQGHGVRSISASLVRRVDESERKERSFFARSLSKLLASSNSKSARITLEEVETSARRASNLLREFDNEGLGSVRLLLHSGGKITPSDYLEREEVLVGVTNGIPNVNEIETALETYFQKLTDHARGKRHLKSDGWPVNEAALAEVGDEKD